MSGKILTIIMPTYNSENTIRFSLESIKKQSFGTDEIECLVIDGGSTDSTLEIAREYPFVKILFNPDKVPEIAKLIGFNNALGKYVMKMDSDEELESVDAISNRLKAFEAFPDSHIIVANELKPAGKGISNKYSNCCGDPFSFFIYNPKKTIIETYSKNIVKHKDMAYLLKFDQNEVRPIADGGTTTFDREYILINCDADRIDVAYIASVSDKIMDLSGACVSIKNDNILHHSRGSLKGYLKKIKFRIINNIFAPSESGCSNRQVSTGYKKYLFPFYVISFVLPFIDSLKLTVRYKSFSFMLHIFYCWYAIIMISWYYLLKLLKIKKVNKEY